MGLEDFSILSTHYSNAPILHHSSRTLLGFILKTLLPNLPPEPFQRIRFHHIECLYFRQPQNVVSLAAPVDYCGINPL
jgi:hypothetical protein